MVAPHPLRCSQGHSPLRVLPPTLVRRFAEDHDDGLWSCLCQLLGVSPNQSDIVRASATAPLTLGGLGLRSAVRTSESAYWASWADCLHMMQERHPEVAREFVTRLEAGVETSPCLGAAATAPCNLAGTHGFEPPSWTALALGARPPPREPDDHESGAQRLGWQHEACSRVELQFRELQLMPALSEGDRALMRSQSGSGVGVAFSTTPCTPLTSLEPQLFRVLLLRRFRLPLPFSRRLCRCGRLLDALGHHRAGCARAGVLVRRGFALESAAARICREAGGRVTTNIFVCDLDITAPDALDSRRLEVVADGLLLFGGAQLAVDTTVVSPLRTVELRSVKASLWWREERNAHIQSSRHRGAGPDWMEVGGRWSPEALTFTRLLARALATSLLELRGSGGADGVVPPSHEVEGDHWHSGLSEG